MDDHYSGYSEENRDDYSCPRGGASTGVGTSHGGQVLQSTGRRSITTISKDVIRTFQTTIQSNVRSQQMMPENAPVSPYIQPRLQKIASEGSRIAQSVQQSAIVDGVTGKLSDMNDKLGSMLRRSSTGSFSVARDSSDRGIYSSQSVRSWGSTVSAEISTFTSTKVAPLFRRQNTCPSSMNYSSEGNVKVPKVVSFDYQLMKDNE